MNQFHALAWRARNCSAVGSRKFRRLALVSSEKMCRWICSIWPGPALLQAI